MKFPKVLQATDLQQQELQDQFNAIRGPQSAAVQPVQKKPQPAILTQKERDFIERLKRADKNGPLENLETRWKAMNRRNGQSVSKWVADGDNSMKYKNSFGAYKSYDIAAEYANHLDPEYATIVYKRACSAATIASSPSSLMRSLLKTYGISVSDEFKYATDIYTSWGNSQYAKNSRADWQKNCAELNPNFSF